MVAKALAARSLTAHPAAMTARTPMPRSDSATLAATRLTPVRSRLGIWPTWQALRNTRSGTTERLENTLAVRWNWPPMTMPVVASSAVISPWPAMCTMRQSPLRKRFRTSSPGSWSTVGGGPTTRSPCSSQT